MSYAIGHLVFGIEAGTNTPLYKILDEIFEYDEDKVLDFLDEYLDNEFYCAGGDIQPALLGGRIMKFDETKSVSWAELVAHESVGLEKASQKYAEMLHKLPDNVYMAIREANLYAKTFIMWSSS